MKDALKRLFILIFVIFIAFSASAAEKTKNKHIKRLMDDYIAVFDFEVTGVDKNISRPLTDSVSRELVVSGRYTVIDRGNMNKILGEQKFQMSGCVANECIVEAGQLLGVGKIISGSVSIVGKTYYLTLSLINVQTGKIENVAEDECICQLDELLGSTKRLVKKLLGEQIDQRVKETKVSKLPAVAVAKLLEPQPVTGQNITKSIGMTFVYIKPGTFIMGSPANEPGRHGDEIQHQVTITKPFYMQTTEVTQGQWKKIMGTNQRSFGNLDDDSPVERVSWNDIQEFIWLLNQKEGGGKYRLPTEAEWEYADRAGTTTPFGIATGNCLSTDQANYNGDNPLPGCPKAEYRGKTIRVGSFSPNKFGLYDMHGNVCEWVQDWYGDYPPGHVTDPVGPSSGSYRIFRGGSWNDDGEYCRSADRSNDAPDSRMEFIGFRLARTP